MTRRKKQIAFFKIRRFLVGRFPFDLFVFVCPTFNCFFLGELPVVAGSFRVFPFLAHLTLSGGAIQLLQTLAEWAGRGCHCPRRTGQAVLFERFHSAVCVKGFPHPLKQGTDSY